MGIMHKKEERDQGGLPEIFVNNSDFILIEQHVWDSVCDWKLPARFWTDKVSIYNFDLKNNIYQ